MLCLDDAANLRLPFQPDACGRASGCGYRFLDPRNTSCCVFNTTLRKKQKSLPFQPETSGRASCGDYWSWTPWHFMLCLEHNDKKKKEKIFFFKEEKKVCPFSLERLSGLGLRQCCFFNTVLTLTLQPETPAVINTSRCVLNTTLG